MNLAATLALNSAPFLSGLGQARAGLGAFRGQLSAILGPLAAMTGGMLSLAGAASILKRAVDEAARMEDLEGSFATLLGSAAAGKQRIQELAKTAASTPFDLVGLAGTSRLLQAFTGNALATGKGLLLVGDMAAAVNQPLEAVGMWVGRLYAALREGQPLGEPIQNLTQLGLISGETRRALMALQGQSLDAAATMGALESAFGRNAGAMARLAQTYNGRMSTLKDTVSALYRELGTPIKDGLKPLLEQATLDLEGLVPTAQKVGRGIAEVLMASYGVVTSGDLAGVLSVGLIAATKLFAANLLDSILRPMRYGAAVGLATFDSIANVFGTSLDTVFLSARVKMKELLVLAMDFASQISGGSGASASLQQSLARDRVALHKSRAQDALSEPTWLGNMQKWLERIPTVQGAIKDDALADLKKIWGDYLADARAKLDAAAAVPKDGPRAAGTGEAASSRADLGAMTTDRLARIGGFIGGAGGPAVDYARRTAAATENLVRDMKQLPAQLARVMPAGGAAAWA